MASDIKKEITMHDLLYESHIGLERQGPGSAEMTLKALSFIDNPDKIFKALDLGCGTGGQTMALAQNIGGEIVGVDLSPEFIAVFNNNAKKLGLKNKAKGVVGSFDSLPFGKAEFDLIWSEGAIEKDLEKLLFYWNGFLRNDGYIAFTIPTWFTDSRPDEISRFWSDAGCEVGTIAENILTLQRAGFCLRAAFTLPEKCWTENYYAPHVAAAERLHSEKYPSSKVMAEYIASAHYEVEIYSKYKQYYGYVFFIGKKI